MARGDAQQRDRRAVGPPPTLFPVPQSVDADPHRTGELQLGEADKAAQSGHIVPRFEATGHEALAKTGGNCPRELCASEFGEFTHRFRSKYSS
jgi:hypothetical protein